MEKPRVRTTEGSLRRVEKGDWRLAYTQEFKNWVHQHPRIIRRVTDKLAEIVRAKRVPDSFSLEDGDLKVTLERKRLKAKIFSIEVGDKKFFLKMSAYPGEEGYDEAISSKEARERIKEIEADLPMGVEVTDYQLGFSQRGLNFFVAPWKNLVPIEQFARDMEYDSEEKRKLDQTITILVGMFQDYADFVAPNMAYDPEADKIVIFDLHKRKDAA